MYILSAVLIISYSLIISFFFIGLFIYKESRVSKKKFLSIVIPTLNEEDNIKNIISDLKKQSYPTNLFEIIIIDDNSKDNTVKIIKSYQRNMNNLKLLSSSDDKYSKLNFKKKPLSIGINNARGEIILLTDADCRIPRKWIETMSSYFTDEVGFVIGHSQLKTFYTNQEKFEALDFLLLSSAGRSSSQLNFPLACTGQNIAYRKKAFFEVNGFNDFANALGGDDTFLMELIKKKTNWKIVYAVDKDSYVRTNPCNNWKEFFSQRKRWASDALFFKNENPFFFIMMLITFFSNLLPLILFISSFLNSNYIMLLFNVLFLKMFVEFLLTFKATSLFQLKELRLSFIFWFFIQIPYVIYMSINTLFFNNKKWGGRHI
tara:strand:- start:278 stop:1399 length:1122 start_codon:yes stop_codon:yes gene_type:complete